VHLGLNRECALVMASQDIKGDTGDEIDFGVQGDRFGALALIFVGNGAIQRQIGGGFRIIDGDAQFEVERESQPDDIETGANVCRGARGSNDKGGHLVERDCDSVEEKSHSKMSKCRDDSMRDVLAQIAAFRFRSPKYTVATTITIQYLLCLLDIAMICCIK